VLFAILFLDVNAVNAEPACRWTEHESRLTSYTAKIRSLEKEISDLIAHKKTLESTERVRLVTQQISYKHSDLAKVIKDYESERLHVRFQHPDRDLEGERQYMAVKLKSLDEIEESFGLDGRLDRIRRHVGIVLPVAKPEVIAPTRLPAAVSGEEEDAPEQIRLVK
jgi:vacuolar-type H+-ATPase subunit I/STV1